MRSATVPWGKQSLRPCDLKVVTVDAPQGTFQAIAAAFGNLDRTGDIIERGAFTKTLADTHAQKAMSGAQALYPLLMMHDPERPVGVVMTAVETPIGLQVDCRCDLTTQAGREAFSGVTMGYGNQLSIGYDTVKAARDGQGVRHLLEVKLWEISLVTSNFAANPRAQVDPTSVKSSTPVLAHVIEEAMMTMTRDMKRILGYPAWRADPDDDPCPDPPQRDNYRNGDEYEVAREAWEGEFWARHPVARLRDQRAAHAAAFNETVTAARDARVRAGTASLAELRAYASDYTDREAQAQDAAEAQRVRAGYREHLAHLGEHSEE